MCCEFVAPPTLLLCAGSRYPEIIDNGFPPLAFRRASNPNRSSRFTQMSPLPFDLNSAYLKFGEALPDLLKQDLIAPRVLGPAIPSTTSFLYVQPC